MTEAAAVGTAEKSPDPKSAKASPASASKGNGSKPKPGPPKSNGAGKAPAAVAEPAGGSPKASGATPPAAKQSAPNGARRGPSPQQQRREQRSLLSRRKQAQEDALAFVPRKSHPAPVMSLDLCSEHSVALFQKNFGFAHLAFYELVTLLPKKVKMADPDFDTGPLIQGVENILITRLDQVSSSLEQQKRQLLIVMKANGNYPPIKPEEYSNVTKVELPLLTPYTRRMLGILIQFDENLRHLDRIWLETHMPDLEYDKAISNARDEIVRTIRFFKRMHVLGGHLVRGLGQGKKTDISVIFSEAGNDSLPDTMDPETEAQAREVTEAAMGRAPASA